MESGLGAGFNLTTGHALLLVLGLLMVRKKR